MGTLCVQSSEEGAECRATMAAIFGQWADSGKCDLRALGAGGVEWLEGSSVVLGIGHDDVVGALLHDSPIGRVLWTSRPVVVAGVRA